jgi:hypothetical protein
MDILEKLVCFSSSLKKNAGCYANPRCLVGWKRNRQISLDNSKKKSYMCRLKALVVPIVADFYPQ